MLSESLQLITYNLVKEQPIHSLSELMEQELPKLKFAPSFKRRFEMTTTTISRGDSETDLPRYTSLKDVMSSLSPGNASAGKEPGSAFEFDSANIAIRNELVKHAASAYVLSAAVNPVSRNPDWIAAVWEKMKTSCVGIHAFWQVHVRMPLQALCLPIVRVYYVVVHRIRNGLRGKVEIT